MTIISTSIPAKAQSITRPSMFRISPSNPEQVLNKIYNNALAGSDRLEDIENYMSRGLRSSYRAAVKNSSKGKKCDIPKIIMNGQVLETIHGFKVVQNIRSWRSAEAEVRIDTRSKDLLDNDKLKNFDPEIYERIKFEFTKFVLEWKIDNIIINRPILEGVLGARPEYKKIDLRQLLKNCQKL